MVLLDSDGTEKVVPDSDIKATCAAFTDTEGGIYVLLNGDKNAVTKMYLTIGYAMVKDRLGDSDDDSFGLVTDAIEHLRDRGL